MQFSWQSCLLHEGIDRVAARGIDDERVEQHGAVRVVEGSDKLSGQSESFCLTIEGL